MNRAMIRDDFPRASVSLCFVPCQEKPSETAAILTLTQRNAKNVCIFLHDVEYFEIFSFQKHTNMNEDCSNLTHG
jgi:hypothetical protein